MEIFQNFHFLPFSAVLGVFWLFLARCGHALGRVATSLSTKWGGDFFLMVGGDSGTYFVIFGGCLRPQNTFLAFQMTKNGVLKPFLGPHRGKQFLQKKMKITNPWQQGPCRVTQWPPDARAASGCIFSARTCMHGIVTEIPPQLVANFACFEW